MPILKGGRYRANHLKLKIEIGGEKEFKNVRFDIDRPFKELGSEMKCAVLQFNKNDRSAKPLPPETKACIDRLINRNVKWERAAKR